MFSYFDFLLPLLVIVLITIPLISVFRGQATKQKAKRRLGMHIASFFSLLALTLIFQFQGIGVFAATDPALIGTTAQGLGFLGAALATGMSSLGAGIAVAAAAPAAIGAFSENEKNFGKSLIFVALGEGIALYGILISVMIIGKL
ncbi:MAG: ATP synthase subunit C [Candidatus Izemoplasmatales bacterium]